MIDTKPTWLELGGVPCEALSEARMELHFAAQSVSGVGRTFGAPRDDDSHTALTWAPMRESLASRTVPGNRRVHAELQFGTLSVLLFAEGEVAGELSLRGLSPSDADEWMSNAVAQATSTGELRALTALHYDMPAHPIRDGARFSGGYDGEYVELSKWYGNAASVLSEVRERESNSSDVLCWPHHFDLATLLNLGNGRSVGVGLSPGDASYDQPYFYVGPYPRPNANDLPALIGPGRWHTEGFVAAVLTGADIVGGNDAAGQYSLTTDFLEGAISASKKALGAEE